MAAGYGTVGGGIHGYRTAGGGIRGCGLRDGRWRYSWLWAMGWQVEVFVAAGYGTAGGGIQVPWPIRKD